MRKVCFSSSRIIRPLVNSTDILVRGAHQAKAQAPNATVNTSEHDLKLVNGEENFQFFYTCISVLSLVLIRLGSSVTFFFVLTKGEHSRAPCVSQLTYQLITAKDFLSRIKRWRLSRDLVLSNWSSSQTYLLPSPLICTLHLLMEENKIINVTKKPFFSNLITFYLTLLTFIRRWEKSSGLEKNIVHFQAELVKPVLNADFAVCRVLWAFFLVVTYFLLRISCR